MGFFKTLWDIYIPVVPSPMGIKKNVHWELFTFPWDLKIHVSHGKNNPMGKFNFPLEFLPLFLIISSTGCNQAKSNVFFYYAEPDLQHGGNGFCLC